MTVLSDKWIKKIVKQKGMIKPFVDKQVRKGKFPLDYLLTDMTQEFLTSSKFSLMLMQVLLILKFLKKIVL